MNDFLQEDLSGIRCMECGSNLYRDQEGYWHCIKCEED